MGIVFTIGREQRDTERWGQSYWKKGDTVALGQK